MLKRLRNYDKYRVDTSVAYLRRQGLIKRPKPGHRNMIELTDLGKAQAMKYKARQSIKVKREDELSTFVIFDIPEPYKRGRDFLRRLLQQNDFTMVQRSVFVGRWNLTSEFWNILEELNIAKFVSILEGRIIFHRN